MAWTLVVFVMLFALPIYAWHDKAHIAVMEASNVPYSPCVAIAPDILTVKLPREAANHFAYISRPRVTTEDVFYQVKLYDTIDSKGHLYGSIIAATNNVQTQLEKGARPDYNYGFLAHYVGDLSQPLHNSPYDSFNKANHNRIDGIVDDLPKLTQKIIASMTTLHLHNITDVATSVAKVANYARAIDIALRCRGTITHDDAVKLLSKSATLLRAISEYLRVGLSTAK